MLPSASVPAKVMVAAICSVTVTLVCGVATGLWFDAHMLKAPILGF